MTGDTDELFEQTPSYISDVILSNNIKKDAVPGDRVGRLFVVRKGLDSLYQLPEYKITLNGEIGDSAMFELKDGWLYLTDKYEAGKSEYGISMKIEDPVSGEVKTLLKTVTTLSTSQSNSQHYPDFDISETAETAEFLAAELPADGNTVDENGGEKTPSPINWLYVAVATVICMAVVSITAVLRRNNNNG